MAERKEVSLDNPGEIVDKATARAHAIEQGKSYITELLDLYALNPTKREKVQTLAADYVADLINMAYDAAEGKILG